MPTMTCGDAIAQSLIAHGVDTVFGLPGAQVYGLFDAFHRTAGQLKVIGARHEQATAYMAFGYARSTGKAGVCAVVPGPGVLNAGAGLCTAYGSNQPVLCLTGQVPSDFLGLGRGHLHELPDQLATLRSFVKWADRIDHPALASASMAEAFRQMQSGRMGPVALEIPWDVFGMSSDVTPVAPLSTDPCMGPDTDAVKAMVDVITGARHPMIVAGGGAVASQAEVMALAERLNAPVVAFRNGRGIMPEDAPLSVNGVAAYELWPDTDLVIGIGSRLELTHMRWPYRPSGQKLVRIDIDPRALVRLKPDVALVSDAAMGTAAVLDALEKCDTKAESRHEAIRAATKNAKRKMENVQPHMAYLRAIRQVLPRDGIFVKDLCQAGYTSYYGFPVYAPRTYITSGHQGTLGFGSMTALGAKIAHPDKPVICIAGDGGFLFGVEELATAVQYGINTVTVVFDNGAYGNVRRDQKNMYEGRIIAAELRNPDLVKLAESFGVAGYRVQTPKELIKTLERAFSDDSPAVIQVPVDHATEGNPWPLLHPAPPGHDSTRVTS